MMEYVDVFLAVYAALVTIAAITPTEKDNHALARMSNLVKLVKNTRRR